MNDEQRNPTEALERYAMDRGYQEPSWEDIGAIDAEYVSALAKLSAVPWRRNHLEAKTKELILLALASAVTLLDRETVSLQVQRALDRGAGADEIMTVLELSSVLGVHSCTVGVPILLEEMEALGIEPPEALGAPDRRATELKEAFIEKRGYWSELWEGVLAFDPDFFEAYMDLSAVSAENATLDAKTREFVFTAIDASTTHLFEPGLRIHIRNALELGATPDELVEVLELTSVIGGLTPGVGVAEYLKVIDGQGHQR